MGPGRPSPRPAKFDRKFCFSWAILRPSQRKPRFKVSRGRIFQSSWTYPAKSVARKKKAKKPVQSLGHPTSSCRRIRKRDASPSSEPIEPVELIAGGIHPEAERVLAMGPGEIVGIIKSVEATSAVIILGG